MSAQPDTAADAAAPDISRQLEALELSRGRATASKRNRRDSIDSLLANLSSWDLIYIRNRFRDGKIVMDGFAGLRELPPEVFSSVVPHLNLEDVMNCYQVCRSWRVTWTQGAVATALCRRFFPGLLELYGGDVPDRHVLFLAAAKRYLRRHHMRTTQRSFISWDIGWNSDDFTNRQDPTNDLLLDLGRVDFGYSNLTICYQNGKLAWQPGNCYVIIDDLRTRERHRFTFGIDYISGRPMQLQAVTESLVVLASSMPPYAHSNVMDYGQAIQVFSLETMESKRLSLPGKIASCYAQGDRVVFVTKQGHVILWGWSERATCLEVDHDQLHHRPFGWDKDLGGVPGVLFHPTETDVLYVVWMNSVAPPDTRINTIVVVKYEDGEPVRRFETSISHPRYQRDPDSRHSCPSMRFTLTCQKINAYGLHNIGIAQWVLSDDLSYWHSDMDGKEVEWLQVGFNVLTESFIMYEYQSQRHPYTAQIKPFDVCAWDDQLIITWFDEYLIGRQYPYGMQWLNVRNVIGDDYGQRSNGADGQAMRQRRDICAYMLEIGFGRQIFADEDFVIVTTGQGFLVCSWNQELSVPGQVAEEPADRTGQASWNPPWPQPGEKMEPPRLPSLWDCRTVVSLKHL